MCAEKNIDEIIAERLETMDKSLNEVSKVITEKIGRAHV